MLTEATYKYCNCRSPENPARSMLKIKLLLRYLQEKKTGNAPSVKILSLTSKCYQILIESMSVKWQLKESMRSSLYWLFSGTLQDLWANGNAKILIKHLHPLINHSHRPTMRYYSSELS